MPKQRQPGHNEAAEEGGKAELEWLAGGQKQEGGRRKEREDKETDFQTKIKSRTTTVKSLQYILLWPTW